MQKQSPLARTAHPITSSMSKSKAWTKFADRALGAAVAAVGVVFLFHPAPWFIVGIVITVAGLALLIAALFVDVPEPPTPPPPPEELDLKEKIREARKANESLSDLLNGTEPPATPPSGGLASEEATDASSS